MCPLSKTVPPQNSKQLKFGHGSRKYPLRTGDLRLKCML
jgi:hypothetical protein